MTEEHVPTGIDGLDFLIEGGFPRGSMILVAGNPGTGKTIFGVEFLYQGATKFFENGVWVSFAESRETLNMYMRRFGMDFERLEREGKIRVLDLVTIKEVGMETVMEMIASEIRSLEATRLVIDSFSAMTGAFERRIDARILIHILGKMIRQTGCTTLLITEILTGDERIGLGVEEFVADGILIFKKARIADRPAREIEIAKLRGARLEQIRFFFSLEDGFHVFPPIEPEPIEKPQRFQLISDSAKYFSTGNKELDKMLGGGYPRGSTVLIEIGKNVSTPNYHLIVAPTAVNFISQSRGVMIIPNIGTDADYTLKIGCTYGLNEEEMHTFLRVAEKRTPNQDQNKPYILPFEAKAIEEDYLEWRRLQNELRKKTGQPILEIVAIDCIEAMFGEDAIKYIAQGVTDTRKKGNLTMILSKPGMEKLTKKIANFSEVHLRLMREHGATLLYGLKPRTGINVIQIDVSKGYPLAEITPIL